MTTWSKEPPSEPGWYWCRAPGCGPFMAFIYERSQPRPDDEFGPAIPTPEAIEAAKDALRRAAPFLFNAPLEGALDVHDAVRAALAKLEGR